MNLDEIRQETEGAILTVPPDGQVHALENLFFWFDDEGIGYGISRKSGKRTLEKVKKSIEELRARMPDGKVCMIIDSTYSSENTYEARQYASAELPKLLKALAIVSGSAFGRMVANIYVVVSSQPYPIRFFSNVEDARNWLRQYL